LKNALASTDDDDQAAAHSGRDEDQSGAEDGDGDDDYEFKRESGDDEDEMLDLERKVGEGGIFDKRESDSEVEEFMENLENDELEMDGLKLPSDGASEESGAGLDEYDAEEGASEDEDGDSASE